MDLWKKDKKQEDLYEKAAKTVHICWNFSGFAFPFSAIALEEQPEELAIEAEIASDFQVLAENHSLRKETAKYFVLSDGSFTAVQYPFPVHYSTGSSWEDYDNTPVFVEEENFRG